MKWIVFGAVCVLMAAWLYSHHAARRGLEHSPERARLAALPSYELPCTADCGDRDAGYRWAKENDITDEDDCDSSSQSFVAGCKAYVKQYGSD